MLSKHELEKWFEANELSNLAREAIQRIRSCEPSRRVQGGRRNVSGFYPSRKMGVTIQFESHRVELPRIYELEHDPDVLEYYDQPPPIELVYKTRSGRRSRHKYTPDFFVIRTDSAGWEECKTVDELEKLAEKSPNRYTKEKDGKWQCPPANEYAKQHGFNFTLWTNGETNWVFQQNIIWIEDYLRPNSPDVTRAKAKEIIDLVASNQAITLAKLLSSNINPDNLYRLIATQELYVDLHVSTLSEPSQVKVFLDEGSAIAYQRASTVHHSAAASRIKPTEVEAGDALVWDGEPWEVVNKGLSVTALLKADGKFVELPNAALEKLISQHKITILSDDSSTQNAQAQELLSHASPKDTKEANKRFEVIQPYLARNAPTCPNRTIRRWRNSFWNAEELYGNGYVGLLPRHGAKGNRKLKLNDDVRKFMVEYIRVNYENLKHRSVTRVYEAFVEACETHSPKLNPPSHVTFCTAVKKRSGPRQTRKRMGRRAAIQQEQFYWELELTTPRHGSRPFEIVHIDHTQMDIELVSSLDSLTNCNINVAPEAVRSNLGRPWATFMVDAYSRRLLAVYITYEEPSYRSCMMALRVCVQRFKRLPQTIVVDNGAEFHSHYFEQLLAHYSCTKKHRPPARARFGAVVERLFGTANTQLIYELQGNTQLMKNVRQVTKSVSPDKLAVWSIGNLYEALCKWAYEVYDHREHPAIGLSPHDAYSNGLLSGGSRSHLRVNYDETFTILTLPEPDRGRRKVQPSRGIKINNIYYWCNDFRDPELERSLVDAKYDPFDASVAYAYVRNRWVKCISSHYQYLQGRTEKEIKLATTEINRRKQSKKRKTATTDKELVQFLNSTQAKEGSFLKQRLRALENKAVLQVIEGGLLEGSKSVQEQTDHAVELRVVRQNSQEAKEKTCLSVPVEHEDEPEVLEYYGEF